MKAGGLGRDRQAQRTTIFGIENCHFDGGFSDHFAAKVSRGRCVGIRYVKYAEPRFVGKKIRNL
jgi:hypothetical protein